LTKEDINREIAELEENTVSDKDAIAYILTHFDVRMPDSIKNLFEKEINETVIQKDQIKEKIIEFISN
jgi:threonine synthase